MRFLSDFQRWWKQSIGVSDVGGGDFFLGMKLGRAHSFGFEKGNESLTRQRGEAISLTIVRMHHMHVGPTIFESFVGLITAVGWSSRVSAGRLKISLTFKIIAGLVRGKINDVTENNKIQCGKVEEWDPCFGTETITKVAE
ncbi:unnamed protein product [Sphenostylis stenocarpa]|uniref:Uncharacterized protein n=1 Tax=Sphenostylis stenocarpa TaxID=92480 RepID=A0AA86SCQ0_9FABA|nr:unnamed protein product [Sphenostylis stenocarpa]